MDAAAGNQETTIGRRCFSRMGWKIVGWFPLILFCPPRGTSLCRVAECCVVSEYWSRRWSMIRRGVNLLPSSREGVRWEHGFVEARNKTEKQRKKTLPKREGALWVIITRGARNARFHCPFCYGTHKINISKMKWKDILPGAGIREERIGIEFRLRKNSGKANPWGRAWGF